MKLLQLATRIALFLAIAFLAHAQSTIPANLIKNFAGSWKENESKHKFGSGAGATLRFRGSPSGGLDELRGAIANPVVQKVEFDGKPHPIDDSRSAIAWKKLGATQFERSLFDNDKKLINIRRIELSADGKSLTERIENKTSDGKTATWTGAYNRTSGESGGLAGTWQLVSRRRSDPAIIRFEPAGANSLKFVIPDSETTGVMTFDGKPYTWSGRGLISGMENTAKAISGRSIEVTIKRKGVLASKTTYNISADGRTLTMTGSSFDEKGKALPGSVVVYEKQ
ncbi:MAG: hypothetical protein IT165_33740 [Bryobacterales bacterium]|nr:hypothetical protein [Bryobacterales bacterium]